MQDKEKLFKLLDKTRIRLFYGSGIVIFFFFVIPKIFNFLNYTLTLISTITLYTTLILTGTIYLIEGVYIRKLLVVGRRGVYDYYYKKTAIMQGVLLFLIFISMTTSLISRNNLVAIFGLFMIALSILFHIIFGRGK